jgi:hypothetical protein
MENARERLIRQETLPRVAGGAGGGTPTEVCLGEYVDRIAKELHERVEHQRAVLRKALASSGAGRDGIPYCPLVECRRVETLRSAIRETIDVLEETRSAFKSKRLEVMRKKLCEILTER